MGSSVLALGVVCWLSASAAAAAQLADVSSQAVADPRFFLVSNSSNLSLSVDSVASAVVALVFGGLLAALLVFLLMTLIGGGGGDVTGYSGSASGYSDAGASGYSGSARAALSQSLWSGLSAVDWIGVAEELYSAADPGSQQCQQQLVCQLRRSAPAWGETARSASGVLDYLPYLQLLKLPESAQQLVSQYELAASLGRSSGAHCDELFPNCGFSLRGLTEKYGPVSS